MKSFQRAALAVCAASIVAPLTGNAASIVITSVTGEASGSSYINTPQVDYSSPSVVNSVSTLPAGAVSYTAPVDVVYGGAIYYSDGTGITSYSVNPSIGQISGEVSGTSAINVDTSRLSAGAFGAGEVFVTFTTDRVIDYSFTGSVRTNAPPGISTSAFSLYEAGQQMFQYIDPAVGVTTSGMIGPGTYNFLAGVNVNAIDTESATADFDLTLTDAPVAPVPLPAAVWLVLSGVGALGAVGRRRKAA